MRATRKDADPCAYIVGEDGLARWQGTRGNAWTGLLHSHRRLTRGLEAALQERHGLSLSALELLGRLAVAAPRQLRIARLADQGDLSLSRTSRILDTLERRALVERQPCPEDSRASNVLLTDLGLRLTRAAQADYFAGVQRQFFDQLTESQLSALAAAFAHLAGEPDRQF